MKLKNISVGVLCRMTTICLGLILLRTAASPSSEAGAQLVECQARAGCPNLFARLESGGPVRIAYLGGSITEAEGWRVLVQRWLTAHYPQSAVSEIRATISGTGAEFGVCRLEEHVLKFNPDLVFVEFAVNGTGNTDQRSLRTVEGIVRKIWRSHPQADICFVHTLASWFLKDIQAGRKPRVVQLMDQVADHYGVPSVQLGLEVARLEAAGQLIFKGKKPQTAAERELLGGKVVFSADGVHPFVDTGHPFYLDALVRSLPQLRAGGKSVSHVLPAPLDPQNWEAACLVPVDAAKLSPGWEKVSPPGETEKRQRISQYIPAIWRTAKPGAALKFAFEGTGFGLAGFRGADSGLFSVTVDEDAPVKATFFDQYTYAGNISLRPWFFPRDLAHARHRVKIELLSERPDKAAILREKGVLSADLDKNTETVLYLGAILLSGTLVSDPQPAVP